jgi:hypothetical protein
MNGELNAGGGGMSNRIVTTEIRNSNRSGSMVFGDWHVGFNSACAHHDGRLIAFFLFQLA